MGLAPGSVWLDARGTQSAAHGERGVARYVAEHTKALLRLGTGADRARSGWIPSVLIPPSMQPLDRLGPDRLAPERRGRRAGRVPGIYHVMSPFEVTMDFDDIWPAWLRQWRRPARRHALRPDPAGHARGLPDRASGAAMGTVWMARLGLIRSAHQVLRSPGEPPDDAIERLGIPEERMTVIDSGVSGHHSSLVGSREEAEAICSRSARPKIRPGLPALRRRRRRPQEHGGHDPGLRAAA